MSANRVIDDHKELENIGTLTHDQIDKTIYETPWVVLSASVEEQLQGRRVLQAGTGISITDGGPGGTVTISSLGSGTGTKIGLPEFGSEYLDGLFTDFQTEMPVGTPIDRFNQVLKLFAPAAAPNLQTLNALCDQQPIDAYLSFGTTSEISGVSNVAGVNPLGVNQLYSSGVLSNGDHRLGVKSPTILSGTLNFSIPSDTYENGICNHTSGVLGNADKGYLQLVLNDQVIHTLNLSSYPGLGLPGSATGESLNSNGSGFTKISIAQSATFVDGRIFPIFKHRSVDYTLSTHDQRKGWNILKVIHVIGSTQYATNSIEWINHDSNVGLTVTSGTLSLTNASGGRYLTGVEYYTSAEVEYATKIYGLYDYVYDNQNITFISSDVLFSQVSKDQINVSIGENHQKIFDINETGLLSTQNTLNSQVSVGVNATHPFKLPLNNSAIAYLGNLLLFNPQQASDPVNEYFGDENYRLQDKNYLNQGDITTSHWDSTVHLNTTSGYNFGLIVYDNKLISPINTWKGGDFRNTTEGGQLEYSPDGNPDYSNFSGNAVLSYYRNIKNETTFSYRDFSLVLSGSSTIVPHSTTLTTNDIKLSIKIPGKTGWLDLTNQFELNLLSDGDGTSFTAFPFNLNTKILGTFGTTTVEPGESVVLKVEALASWIGHLSSAQFSFGASTGSGPINPPTLNSINSTISGVSSKLSFGSVKPVTGYSNSVVLNLNDQSSPGGNHRGTFNGSQPISGNINGNVVSQGYSYSSGAFIDGNKGTLKLVVNDVLLVSIDLTDQLIGNGVPGFGVDQVLNSNGSGFINISSWKASLWSDGFTPDYTKIYRTADFIVGTSDQRQGSNNVKIIHTINSIDRITNIIEWINDSDSSLPSISDVYLTPFGQDEIYYQSGVKYFASPPTGSFSFTVNNIYKNVYSSDSDAISLSKGSYVNVNSLYLSGVGINPTTVFSSITSLRQLKTIIDSQDTALYVTSSLSYTKNTSLIGNGITSNSATIGGISIKHPLKGTIIAPPTTTTGFLIYSGSNSSTQDFNEYFVGENYRLVDTTYQSQQSVMSANNVWDSKISMNDPTYSGYYTGLLVFNDRLIAPCFGGVNGDFRSSVDGGQIPNSPRDNVDYTNVDLATRNYIRSFKNSTINDVPQVIVTLFGSGELVPKSIGLTSNKFYVELKIPGKTGWLDLAKPSEGSGNIIDGDGGLSGNLTSMISTSGTSNICTFNGQTVDGTISTGGEFILIKITTSDNWVGYLDRIQVQYS